MIIKADGKTIRDGAFTMRQALHIANNTGECLTAKRLEIINDGADKKETAGASDTVYTGYAQETAPEVNETATPQGAKDNKKKRGK